MSLARQVVEAARAAEVKIATAESCTGGMLAAALTDIAGASAVFDRGFITYSYTSKPEVLGVNPETVASFGAVSAEVVAQMASGALAHSDADIAVAITGIAGPVEGSDKPEGRVWFAIATDTNVAPLRREFGAIGRAKVRAASVEQALSLLLGTIKR
jgi:nicotinamide-nucleotide amidase